MFVMIASRLGGGYEPSAQYPRCEPPFNFYFQRHGTTASYLYHRLTAISRSYVHVSEFISLVFDAFTRIPYCSHRVPTKQ